MAAFVLQREREWREGVGSRVAYAPDGRAWATASVRALLVVEDDEPSAPVALPGGPAGTLAFSADGRRVLLAPHAYDRAAGAWSAPDVNAALAHGLDPGAADGFAVHGAAWDAEGGALAVYAEYRAPRGIGTGAGAGGPRARLVLLDGGATLLWEGDRTSPQQAIAVAEGFVAAGGSTIGVWERPTGRPLAVLEDLETLARTLRLSHDGRHLAAGAAGGAVAVWETAGWEPVGAWAAHPDEAAGLAFHPGGEALATGGADGTVRLWGLDGTPLGETAGFEGPVQGLAFRPDGGRLLAAQAGLDAAVVALAVTAAR